MSSPSPPGPLSPRERGSNTGTNSTLLRGLTILQQVAQSSRGLSAIELAEALDIPKPTAHRIASQLEEAGFLQRSPANKRFVIGTGLKDFALSVLANGHIGAARHAVLAALSEEIGETCNCTMLDGNQTVYFDRVECNWPIRISLHPGSRLPLHATASGKLFLAFMNPQDREQLLTIAPLSRNTERTMTDPALLAAELDTVRETQVGLDDEELFTGMVAVAVPVFDQAGGICFTVAVHAPTARKSLDDLRCYIPSLRRAAEALAASYCTVDNHVETKPHKHENLRFSQEG